MVRVAFKTRLSISNLHNSPQLSIGAECKYVRGTEWVRDFDEAPALAAEKAKKEKVGGREYLSI